MPSVAPVIPTSLTSAALSPSSPSLGWGPLSRPWPFFQFAALALAPIIPAADTQNPKATHDGGSGAGAGEPPLHVLARVVAKLSLIAGGVGLLQFKLPNAVLEMLYSLGLFAVLGLLMDGPAALFTSLLGFQVAPHFDEPWRVDSVASFWAKRWNLAAGSTLRDLLYDPILEGRLIPATRKARGMTKQTSPSSSRRLAGMVACFLGSAAMHELQFWYFKGHWSGGRYGGFFLAQVPMLLGERLLYGGLRRRGITVPRLVRAAVTLAVLLWTSHHYFWAPLREQGIMAVAEEAVTARVLEAKAAFGFVKR
ncbi:hypothetical protein N2152v2_002488 [Parachlorella kessleri]